MFVYTKEGSTFKVYRQYKLSSLVIKWQTSHWRQTRISLKLWYYFYNSHSLTIIQV